ncbi:hypothetical protein NE237_008627 [Protea cynaroides]|uniref:Uncharacterized protein n=1 Tax=Protea cynaroides TaxID=273540 RepID=A0A9Q0QZV4_9MAGN|nr:hypothetical protein NE237_008627 [Protea cynaroides]
MIDVTRPTSPTLADSSSSTSSDSSDSSSTSSSNASVYMEGLEEFGMEGGTQESPDDVIPDVVPTQSKGSVSSGIEVVLALPKSTRPVPVVPPRPEEGEYLSMGGNLSEIRWIPLMGDKCVIFIFLFPLHYPF